MEIDQDTPKYLLITKEGIILQQVRCEVLEVQEVEGPSSPARMLRDLPNDPDIEYVFRARVPGGDGIRKRLVVIAALEPEKKNAQR